MKLAKNVRRAVLASCLTATTLGAMGCTSTSKSIASLNPFKRSSASTPASQTQPHESIAANQTDGTPATTVGSKSQSFFGKTTEAITGVFRKDKPESDAVVPEENDPLSLSNKPEKVSPDIYAANGRLWESSGDFDKAAESYQKALAEDPQHSTALTSIARLNYRQGKMNEAAKYFQRALAQNPQDAAILNDLGLTLGKLGNNQAAIASLQQALQVAPGTSRYANNLASIQFESGDTTGALASLMQNNKPAVAHFNMAYLYYKAGKADQAKGHLNESLKFEPQAASDAAIGRAVERSRDMLAQLGTPSQSLPEAAKTVQRIAGAPSYTAPLSPQPNQPVVATVSSIQSAANQAVSAITPPPAPPIKPVPDSTLVTPLPPPQTGPAWNSWTGVIGDQEAQATHPEPSSQTEPATPNPTPAPAKDVPETAAGFILPGGFKAPAN